MITSVFCELNFEIPQSFPDLQKKDFFNKFPWKNANYKVIYSSIVSNNFTVLFNEIEKIDDPKLTIDYIVESFPKIMIKSARQAEKDLGYITSNGVKRKCFSPFPNEIGREIKVLIFNIKNNKLDRDKQRIYRKRLRQLQRVNIHNNFRNKSIQLDRLLTLDKNSFWKKIASFKRSVKKRATIDNYQPSLKDFSKYYKDLFSHSDRISNRSHLEVEDIIKKHVEKIKEKKLKQSH